MIAAALEAEPARPGAGPPDVVPQLIYPAGMNGGETAEHGPDDDVVLATASRPRRAE